MNAAIPTGLAHVILSLEPGGTERLVIDLAVRCSQRYPTRVYCLDQAGGWAEQLPASVPVAIVGRRPGWDLGVAWRLKRLATQHRIAILHCHQYTPFVYGSLAVLGRRRLRLVYTEHGRLSDAPPSRRRRLANRWLSPFPSFTAAVSGELRRFMIAEGFPDNRVAVVHNGIDPGLEPTSEARAAARSALGLAENEIALGTAARFDPVKNLDVAIDALVNVRLYFPSTVLVLIGDGPERSRLEALAASHNVGHAVRWTGYRDDVRRLLPGLDVYLNTSIYEGVSVTILEAMAAGLPVVATNVGGTSEVVTPDVTGLLVASRDASALARALVRVIGDGVARVRFGMAGRRRVQSEFTVERMFDRYIQEYER